MTKGELIAILQGPLMKYSAECPVIIETSSEYFQIEKIKYDPSVKLIVIISEKEVF